MAPGVGKVVDEGLLTRVHGGMVHVAPVALVKTQRFELGDMGIVTKSPRDPSKLRVVADTHTVTGSGGWRCCRHRRRRGAVRRYPTPIQGQRERSHTHLRRPTAHPARFCKSHPCTPAASAVADMLICHRLRTVLISSPSIANRARVAAVIAGLAAGMFLILYTVRHVSVAPSTAADQPPAPDTMTYLTALRLASRASRAAIGPSTRIDSVRHTPTETATRRPRRSRLGAG